MTEPTPISPCIGICIMDPRLGQCRGCLRTIDEIAGWYEASADEKRALIGVLAARRAEATERKARG